MNFKRLAITISCVALLVGCQGFNYKQAGWQSYRVSGMRGTCVRHHCESICSTCHANEPQCQACWSCIAADGCMEVGNGCTTVITNDCGRPYVTSSCAPYGCCGVNCGGGT